ncbi:hypothetical protein ACRC7T_03200 [Segnochrobactraceae bacterium EtOH-i3]
MKTTIRALLLAGAVLSAPGLVPGIVSAQQLIAPNGERRVAPGSYTANVLNVFPSENRVFLRNQANGNQFTVSLPPGYIQTLGLRTGNNIRVEVLPGELIDARRPDTGNPSLAILSESVVADLPGLPAGFFGHRIVAVTRFLGADAATGTAQFETFDGLVRTVRANSPAVQAQLAQLGLGDLVQATYVEGTAFRVLN